MSQGVFTRMKRFTFVEKTAAEVGAGTAYPMLATADQLAEVMYRVRLSKFTSGYFKKLDDFDELITYFEALNTSTDPTTAEPLEIEVIDFTLEHLVVRGYGVAFSDEDGDLSGEDVAASFLPYYGDKITVTPLGTDFNYREALSEYCIFVPPYKRFGVYDPVFQTGFSFNNFYSTDLTSYNTFINYYALNVASSDIAFSGEVGWVDVDGSGNPMSPNNEMYIGVDFIFFGNSISISTNIDWFYTLAGTETGADFVLELSGGQELKCPIYVENIFDPEFAFDSVQDVRLKAIEWWPYADASGAVWDEDTGLKL
jgi:hypothetical protein